MNSQYIKFVIEAENRAKAVMRDVSDNFDNMVTKLQKNKQLMRTLQNTGRVAFTALSGAIGFSVKAFADFDKAMKNSLAIMGDVSTEMTEKMEEAAKTVSTTTTYSAKQAAEAYYFLASAGLDAQQSIAAMPQVAKFAQAGMFDLALATDLLTDAQSALGLTIRDDTVANMKNMARVSDVLVKANTLANASVQQFSEALTTRAGAALRLVNKDIEEGAAVLAVMADQGVKGAEAGARLDIVLRDLQTATIKNKEEFNRFNIQVFDNQGYIRNLADIVEELSTAMAGLTDEEGRAMLMTLGFQDRSVASLLALKDTQDAIRNYQSELEKAGGITDEVANKQMESLSARLTVLKNKVNLLGISIGESMVPTLELLMKIFGPIAEKVTKFIEMNPKLTATLLAIATGLAGVLMVLSRVIQGITALKIVTLALFKTTPIGWVAAIIGGLVLMYNKFEWFRDFVTTLVEAIKMIGEKFRSAIYNTFIRPLEIFTDLFGKIKSMLGMKTKMPIGEMTPDMSAENVNSLLGRSQRPTTLQQSLGLGKSLSEPTGQKITNVSINMNEVVAGDEGIRKIIEQAMSRINTESSLNFNAGLNK